MICDWFAEVDQRVDGRALAARFGPEHERWLRRHMRVDQVVHLARVKEMLGAYLRQESRVWGASDIDVGLAAGELTALALAAPGLLSAFAAGLGAAQDSRDAWIKKVELADLAMRLDTLGERLRGPVAAKDAVGVREVLLGSNLLSGDDWQCPLFGKDMRLELGAEGTWEQAVAVVARLRYNTVMSFMALWDVAFANSMLPSFQSSPVFLFLAPRVRPDVHWSKDGTGGGWRLNLLGRSAKYREMIDLPLSLLLDVLSLLLVYLERGEFPDEPIALGEMSRLFDKDTKKLDRLRSGRDKLTVTTLLGLLPKDDICCLAVPLLYAAHTWNVILCPPRTAAGRSVLIPDDIYLRYWNAHRSALKARGYAVDGGSIPWPNYLLRPPSPTRT